VIDRIRDPAEVIREQLKEDVGAVRSHMIELLVFICFYIRECLESSILTPGKCDLLSQ
jgi:hypothetical protein